MGVRIIGIRQLGIQKPRQGSGISWSSYWAHQSEVLFFGEISKITGGRLYNQKSGATDYLTVGGAAGSYTFQCPNTAAYKSADTDYIWFKTDETQRTATEAELIGYDLQRTPVKYDDDSPNSIRAIMILSSAVTGVKRDRLFRDMWLMPLWDNNLNAYGHIKSNRTGQNLWTPEPTYPSALSNRFFWYDPSDLSTVTKNESNIVTRVNDKLGNGNDMINGSCEWVDNTLLLNGTNQYLKTAKIAAIVQPTIIYMIFKQITHTNGDTIFDGNTDYLGQFFQTGVTIFTRVYAGNTLPGDVSLALNTWGIAKVLFNGASSRLQIDATVRTGNAGTNKMEGFTLGRLGSSASGYSNIQVKDIIAMPSTEGEAEITAWLETRK